MGHTNIYIVGAQCTGKTTLVGGLEEYFGRDAAMQSNMPLIIREVARSVLTKHSFTAHDIRASSERALALQKLILEAQFQAEQAALEAGRWYISDRSGMDPVVYASKYAGRGDADQMCQSEEWVLMRDRMNRSLVIVCEAGADWLHDDGVRLMPKGRDEWIETHAEFVGLLNDWKVDHVVLPCSLQSLEARVQFVLSSLDDKVRRGQVQLEN